MSTLPAPSRALRILRRRRKFLERKLVKTGKRETKKFVQEEIDAIDLVEAICLKTRNPWAKRNEALEKHLNLKLLEIRQLEEDLRLALAETYAARKQLQELGVEP